MTDLTTTLTRAVLADGGNLEPTGTRAALLLESGTASGSGPAASAITTQAERVGGSGAPSMADAPRRRRGPAQAPDPQRAIILEQTTRSVSRAALALNIPVGEARQRQLDALWAMSPHDRVAAMWRGDLTLFQLTRWSSRAQHEVPLLGREFAYIVMRTPEWAEDGDAASDNVIHLPEGRHARAAA